MELTDEIIKRYCKNVRDLLPCSSKQKKEIMEQLQSNLKEYQVEHPEAGLKQLVNHFGSPEVVASAYIESTGTSELLKALRVRKRIISIIACIMAFALFIWAAAVTIITLQEKRAGAGFAIVELYELPQETVVRDDSLVMDPNMITLP